MSRFTTLGTTRVPLGPCRCEGTPHEDGDEAQVYDVLGWDDLVDLDEAVSEGARQRLLVTRGIASWNLMEPADDGLATRVPISEATVRLLDADTIRALAPAVKAALDRARAALPNVSGAPSRRSRRASAS